MRGIFKYFFIFGVLTTLAARAQADMGSDQDKQAEGPEENNTVRNTVVIGAVGAGIYCAYHAIKGPGFWFCKPCCQKKDKKPKTSGNNGPDFGPGPGPGPGTGSADNSLEQPSSPATDPIGEGAAAMSTSEPAQTPHASGAEPVPDVVSTVEDHRPEGVRTIDVQANHEVDLYFNFYPPRWVDESREAYRVRAETLIGLRTMMVEVWRETIRRNPTSDGVLPRRNEALNVSGYLYGNPSSYRNQQSFRSLVISVLGVNPRPDQRITFVERQRPRRGRGYQTQNQIQFNSSSREFVLPYVEDILNQRNQETFPQVREAAQGFNPDWDSSRDRGVNPNQAGLNIVVRLRLAFEQATAPSASGPSFGTLPVPANPTLSIPGTSSSSSSTSASAIERVRRLGGFDVNKEAGGHYGKTWSEK